LANFVLISASARKSTLKKRFNDKIPWQIITFSSLYKINLHKAEWSFTRARKNVLNADSGVYFRGWLARFSEIILFALRCFLTL
jgi:hypothetical protein